MITDITVMIGTDVDPRLTIRAETAILHASEDNIDKMMTELESYKKSSAQLKDTLKKERKEGNKLKWKFEHLQRDMRTAAAELQALREERQAQEATQEHLEQVQAEEQELKKEKEQLLRKVEDLEEQIKILMQANDFHSQELTKQHQEHLASLTADLEATKEQQVNLQPFKEHILAQKDKMLQLQTSLEDERCKVLQIDNRLEEIMETSSYFMDRSQEVVEVLKARIARM